ncbi:MAG: IS1595 family transposase [Sphingobacteriaceae bacterium]|nr:IS1595 family transposase [Sphingobacteriaceae bacterium]
MRLSEWFRVIIKLIEHPNGIASTTLGRNLRITQKTAWFMTTRLRYAMAQIDDGQPLTGIVQIDQGHLGGLNKNRHFDKKIKYIQNNIDPNYKDKLIFQAMLEENGKIRVLEIPNEEALTIHDCTIQNVDRNALLYTDSSTGYNLMHYAFKNMESVNHKAKQYMNGNCTTNSVEGFWSYVKRHETSHIWISKKYRHLYMQEASARYNMRQMHFQAKFDTVLKATTGRLMYKDLKGQHRIAA